jgi:hypothetical protein
MLKERTVARFGVIFSHLLVGTQKGHEYRTGSQSVGTYRAFQTQSRGSTIEHCNIIQFGKTMGFVRPPLWSSGQSSWLQIRRPGFDSWPYQKKNSGSGTGSTQSREYN